jgi:hypothetical protein
MWVSKLQQGIAFVMKEDTLTASTACVWRYPTTWKELKWRNTGAYTDSRDLQRASVFQYVPAGPTPLEAARHTLLPLDIWAADILIHSDEQEASLMAWHRPSATDPISTTEARLDLFSKEETARLIALWD